MRNINHKIHNEESFTKSYKTVENAQKAVDKAFNKITANYTPKQQSEMQTAFAMFTVKLPSGRHKPIIKVGKGWLQEGIYMAQAGFTIIG